MKRKRAEAERHNGMNGLRCISLPPESRIQNISDLAAGILGVDCRETAGPDHLSGFTQNNRPVIKHAETVFPLDHGEIAPRMGDSAVGIPQKVCGAKQGGRRKAQAVLRRFSEVHSFS